MSSFNFWETIWFIFITFAFIAYLFTLFAIIRDLFRDRTLGGGMKAIWIFFLIFIPFITALVYLVVRGKSMTDRNQAAAQAGKEATDAYIRQVATTSLTDEIDRAQKLLNAGTITPEEFASIKAAAIHQASKS